MDPSELERLLDRELKRLPSPRAPRTLLPAVMAAASRSMQPWYRRPWVTWPAGLQTASVASLALLLALLWTVLPSLGRAAQPLTASLADTLPRGVVTGVQRMNEGATVVKVVLQLLLEPVAAYLSALAIVLTIAFGALWSALDRAALGGASHQ
jgi:hypothetical protein